MIPLKSLNNFNVNFYLNEYDIKEMVKGWVKKSFALNNYHYVSETIYRLVTLDVIEEY